MRYTPKTEKNQDGVTFSHNCTSEAAQNKMELK